MTGDLEIGPTVDRVPAVVHPAGLLRMESSGLVTEVAFDEVVPPVDNQRVLVQRTFNHPGDMSDWHVHPKYTTYGYQLSGQLCVEFGAGGSKRIECGAGDFVRIPASCVQREGAFGDSPRRGIGVRIGSGPPVVDLDGPDSWMADELHTDGAAGAESAARDFATSLPSGGQVVVVREADLDRNETRGLLREIAFEEALPAVRGQRVVVERIVQEPGDRSNWRVHPNSVWYGYQIAGRLRIEFGAGGRDSVEAVPGDFVRIPAGTVHRVIAAGDDARIGVGVCIGSGTPVVDADMPE